LPFKGVDGLKDAENSCERRPTATKNPLKISSNISVSFKNLVFFVFLIVPAKHQEKLNAGEY
jgi:hypothetical protein